MRKYRYWLILVVLSLLLVQCALRRRRPPVKKRPAPAAREKIELTMWTHQNPSFIAANEAIIDRFEELHPNVTITIESFPYDVFIQPCRPPCPQARSRHHGVVRLVGLRYSDRLVEMPDYVMTYSEAEELLPRRWTAITVAASSTACPTSSTSRTAPSWSTRLFEEAGLTYPPQWEIFEDLLEDAQVLTKTDGDMMSVSGFNFVTVDGLTFQLLAGIL